MLSLCEWRVLNEGAIRTSTRGNESTRPVLLSRSCSLHCSSLSFCPSLLSVTSLSPLAYIPYSFVLLPRKVIKRPSTFSLYFCLSVFLPLFLHSRPLTAYPLCNPWHYARSSTTSAACDVMAGVGAVGMWPQGSFACGSQSLCGGRVESSKMILFPLVWKAYLLPWLCTDLVLLL